MQINVNTNARGNKVCAVHKSFLKEKHTPFIAVAMQTLIPHRKYMTCIMTSYYRITTGLLFTDSVAVLTFSSFSCCFPFKVG